MNPIDQLLAALGRPYRKRAIFATSIAALLGSPSAFAATVTWANTGTDFDAGASWVGGVAPTTADAPTFTGPAVTNADLSASIATGTLVFTTTDASGYTISSANGSTLTVVGTNLVSASNTSGTNTISVALTLTNAPTNVRILTQAAGGTLNITGNVSDTSATAGNTDFEGVGTINLSGTNTFNSVGTVTSGGFALNRGSVTLGITGGTTTMNMGTDGMVAGNTDHTGSSGTITVSGGTLNLNGASSVSGAAIILDRLSVMAPAPASSM